VTKHFDIAIIGGGLSASFLALSVHKENKEASIAIFERSSEYSQKVGESIIDLAGLYLNRLGLEHLLAKQTPKTGIRFLFNENSQGQYGQYEFSSPSLRSVTNGYHLDRKTFDSDLHKELESRGVEIFRPAEVDFPDGYVQGDEVPVIHDGLNLKVVAYWWIDASGRKRLLHQKMGWKDIEVDLNTSAAMAHFRNIKSQENWDKMAHPYWDKNAIGSKGFSTIHFMRKNSWWWLIRLNDEITSIGVVKSNEENSNSVIQLFEEALGSDAIIKEVVEGSSVSEKLELNQLAYCSSQWFKSGVALIGDSAGFVDPLLSPGIELIAQQSIWMGKLLGKEIESGTYNETGWKNYESRFTRALKDRMYIYQRNYAFMHSYDLMKVWLRFGNFQYFSFTILPSVRFSRRLKYPLKLNVLDKIAMNVLYKRLKKISEKRQNQNRISNHLPGEISFSEVRVPKGFAFYFLPLQLFLLAVKDYMILEWIELKNALK
jgi:flavin-dependent dehydrogenase